ESPCLTAPVFFRWQRRVKMLRSGMHSPLSFVLSGVIALVATTPLTAEDSSESFREEVTKTLSLDFLLSLPPGYEKEPNQKWPLVVFLHGSGERGSDLEKVALHGPPARVREGAEFPFLLASPQCPENQWWTEQPVLELIDYLERTYRVDPSRIYLTGLSMGGYGTWHFATLAPNRFAAIVPICGGGIPYKMRFILDLPVWAFHGGKDTVVPLEESSRLIIELQEKGNQKTKLTVYPEAGHNSWTEAYQNPELYEWLLNQTLPAKN
ncbi:MAG: prolyl oligopeptidase family serine peptidase, partial [Verrucomicrobiales bacterium]|nr:prolyl oligopeptidase family serine peptidase [Verrucomicrobiales bacterium]